METYYHNLNIFGVIHNLGGTSSDFVEWSRRYPDKPITEFVEYLKTKKKAVLK
jgi:hypothetical protein